MLERLGVAQRPQVTIEFQYKQKIKVLDGDHRYAKEKSGVTCPRMWESVDGPPH